MKLSRPRLVAVLNALYDRGVEYISVEHPCDEIGVLLDIHLDGPLSSSVEIRVGKEEYKDRREDVRLSYDEKAYEDLPDPEDYVRLFVAAGLLEVTNHDEIHDYLDTHAYPDVAAGHSPVVAGIDANLFPLRIPAVLGIDPELPRYDNERPPITGYALSTGVKAELDWHYRQYDTKQFTYAFGKEFERLDGQPAGDNRLGVLGLYEYRQMTADRNADIVQSETGDGSIIDGYERYDEANRKRIFLLSNDYEFVRRAQDRDLYAAHVDFPAVVPRRVESTWETIADLLYVFAIRFGVVTLPKITLYGLWQKKTGRDWQAERLDVQSRSPPVTDALERNRAILDAYDE